MSFKINDQHQAEDVCLPRTKGLATGRSLDEEVFSALLLFVALTLAGDLDLGMTMISSSPIHSSSIRALVNGRPIAECCISAEA
jgi:hypothetical protein